MLFISTIAKGFFEFFLETIPTPMVGVFVADKAPAQHLGSHICSSTFAGQHLLLDHLQLTTSALELFAAETFAVSITAVWIICS